MQINSRHVLSLEKIQDESYSINAFENEKIKKVFHDCVDFHSFLPYKCIVHFRNKKKILVYTDQGVWTQNELNKA